MINDEELIRGIRAGDEFAAEELIKRYYSGILRYCRRHLSDQSLAEDTAQETFYRVFRSLMRYQDKDYFRAWIYMIARNICIDENKKHREVVFQESEDIGKESNEIRHLEDQNEMRKKGSIGYRGCILNIALCSLFFGVTARFIPILYNVSSIGLWIVFLTAFFFFMLKELKEVVVSIKEGQIYGVIS